MNEFLKEFRGSSPQNESLAPTLYAIVTGANKGIGFEICRQLASSGVTVVLTARNEKRGIESVEKLKDFGLFGDVIFHQLDVMDDASVSVLVEFIKAQFGRLDILVNNAGINGVSVDADARRAAGPYKEESQVNWDDIYTQTYDLTVECLQTNYYGAKRLVEASIPLLLLSDSPRIVNVSSSLGKLKNIPNEWARKVLGDAENLTEERVDLVMNQFLEDFKEGSYKTKGWPSHLPAYRVSKAALNAYTRILAKKYPAFQINCVCPGYVKTDFNTKTGMLPVEEGAQRPVRVALMPNDGPSGIFFVNNEESSFDE
ncbi:hypothetical protein Pfo_001252 [Paulownia fortunei]|nr:hypothetical protein Pfo_001252 [Paulownia fortunei]